MDLEQCLGIDQWKDQYTFSQNQNTVTISFPATDSIFVDYIIDLTESTIFAGLKGSPPAVCGKMYARCYREQKIIEKGICKIILSKELTDIWPLFIIGPSSRGIDPKSQFVLGFYKISTFSEDEAYSCFKDSSDRGYIPAKLCVADILLSDINPYNVPKDVPAAIDILKSIPVERRTQDVAICLSDALLSQNNFHEARQALEVSADKGAKVKLTLVKMISPIFNRNGNENDAVAAVGYLESLAVNKNPEALKLLSMHTLKGKGTQKNRERAIELEKEANSIDPKIKLDINENQVLPNLVVVAGLSLAVVTSFLFVLKRRPLH